MGAEIRYLYNSGFTVKTDSHFFIFDYYLDTPKGCGLDKGVVDPDEISGLDVVVFVSHRHPDHYNPRIFGWRKAVKQIRYVLSDDIKTAEDVLKVHPGQEYDMGDFSFRVLDSTDVGAAFLLKADGLCIYHAGDLNLWYWNGEPDADNQEMERRYKEQIDTLKGEKIDLAFVPVDPRLEENELLGLDYFMRTVDAELAVPMHFGDDLSAFDALGSDSLTEDYRGKIAFFQSRGARFEYPQASAVAVSD
jgi:L-ascorbate metabolism protein UlaG (beta-lactamase superfamily)